MLFIKDLPPQSSVDLKVEEPSIYYGQRRTTTCSSRRRLASSTIRKGEDNVYATYEGSGGVPVSSFFRRLLFSIRFRSLKVLLSEDITNDSRVMFHRRLSERVASNRAIPDVRP